MPDELIFGLGTGAGQAAAGNHTHSGAYGFPYTVDPGYPRASDALPVPSGGALFARCREGGTISKIGLEIVVSSGNICVAAYTNSGVGRAGQPTGGRLGTSGAVASPGTGYREIALGGSIVVLPGDWLALSADNGTVTFRSLLAGVATSDLGLGRQLEMAAAHPLPATPSSLTATVGRTIVLIGVT